MSVKQPEYDHDGFDDVGGVEVGDASDDEVEVEVEGEDEGDVES